MLLDNNKIKMAKKPGKKQKENPVSCSDEGKRWKGNIREGSSEGRTGTVSELSLKVPKSISRAVKWMVFIFPHEKRHPRAIETLRFVAGITTKAAFFRIDSVGICAWNRWVIITTSEENRPVWTFTCEHLTLTVSPPRRIPSYLLLYFLIIFYLSRCTLLNFPFCFFPRFLAIFILLSSNNNNITIENITPNTPATLTVR